MLTSSVRHQRSFWTATLLAVVTAGIGLAQRPARPDYSNVDDILNGNHFLLQDDDLIVTAKVDNYALSQNLLYTSNSGIASKNAQFPKLRTNKVANKANYAAVVANMYKNAPPVVVYGAEGFDSPFLEVRSSNPNFGAAETVTLAGPKRSTVRQLVVGDFNGDGLDDVLAVHGSGFVTVCTAKNPAAYDLRLRCGPSRDAGNYTFQTLTAGDFNGDGRAELAWVYQRSGSSTSALWIAEVDPATLAIRDGSTYEGLQTGPLNTLDMVAGKFAAPGNGPAQQIAFAYGGRSGTAKVAIIDFTTPPVRVRKVETWDTGYTPGNNGGESKIVLRAAPFGGFSLYDQIALLVSENSYTQFLAILEVQPNTLSVKKRSAVFLRDLGVSAFKVTDLAIGNFDRRKAGGAHDASMQIAITAWNRGYKFWNAYIFNINPQENFQITLQQQFVDQDATPQVKGSPDNNLTIAAADVQGRSIELGPVTKVVINDQGGPSVVTAVPPMHIDYVAPDGTGPPALLNLSASPNSFSTKFETESSNTAQSTTKESVSYSLGFEQELGAQLSIGVPLLTELSAGLQFAAAQTFENGVEREYSTEQTSSFDVSTQTGWADHVWYDSSRLNIYVYPVLGQSVCPPESVGACAQKDKRPVTVQFSGVDRPDRKAMAGNLIEWYQPVWEYGNILSYPASYSQLLLLYPDMEQLSDKQTFSTDDSVLTVQEHWSTGSGESKTVSSARRFEEGGGLSVEGTAGVVGGSLNINVNNSRAFENLNTAVTNLGSSNGIEIEKPGTLRQPTTYAYNFTPYIFGRTKRLGAVDLPKLNGAIQTAGPLQVAFTVNPLRSWWKQAYSKAPDVALNHPARWRFSGAESAASNCLAETCASLAPQHPQNPWLSDFHAMRGFFITPANSPGDGSQLRVATAGDVLTLRTRVYNYSLVKMPSGTTVHVRFYAQPINPVDDLPAGNSTLIGETILKDGIPPFSSANEAPLNSVLAATTFNTAPFANQYLSFWVVTWMQNSSGAMVKEPDAHGLKSIPGKLQSIADVQTEEYSNNVGFYKWLFFVKSRPGGPAALSAQSAQVNVTDSAETMSASRQADDGPAESASAAAGNDNAALSEVELSEVKVSSPQIKSGESVTVTANLTAGASPVEGGAVAFYDGDPKNEGSLFEMESVPYVQADGKVQVEVSFQPGTCGPHDIYAVAFENTDFEKVSQSAPLTVGCGNNR